MVINNLRRNLRVPSSERIALSWDETPGNPRFTFAKCLNISPEGISVRTDKPMPIRSYVSLRSEKLHLTGSASVKYCIRHNNWYQVGLEFTPGIKFNRAAAASA
jgi:hypothetical protein